jgi:hypothetical protein
VFCAVAGAPVEACGEVVAKRGAWAQDQHAALEAADQTTREGLLLRGPAPMPQWPFLRTAADVFAVTAAPDIASAGSLVLVRRLAVLIGRQGWSAAIESARVDLWKGVRAKVVVVRGKRFKVQGHGKHAPRRRLASLGSSTTALPSREGSPPSSANRETRKPRRARADRRDRTTGALSTSLHAESEHHAANHPERTRTTTRSLKKISRRSDPMSIRRTMMTCRWRVCVL